MGCVCTKKGPIIKRANLYKPSVHSIIIKLNSFLFFQQPEVSKSRIEKSDMRSVQDSHHQSYLKPHNNKLNSPENSPPRPQDHSALLGLKDQNSPEKSHVSNFHKSTVLIQKI